jgi:hypothetical protein
VAFLFFLFPSPGNIAGGPQAPVAPANFRCWKHSRQNTGRPCVGRNGTVVSFPHAEQFVVVSTRSRVAGAPGAGRDARLALQLLHRLGSFLKFLSAKKSCSPAVQVNSVPQSTHVSVLSWNSIGLYLSPTRARPLTEREPVTGTARPRRVFIDPSRADRSISPAASPIRGAASCACACAPRPAWRDGDRLASSRTNAS